MRNTLKSDLKELEKSELIEIIIELSKIDKKNVKFLEVFLKSSDQIDFVDIIQQAKDRIYRFIYGKSKTMNDSLKLREARNVISEFAKLYKGRDNHVADLKLYYVETTNQFTLDFGDISEQFYNSVESMFNNFCQMNIKQPYLFELFKERIEALYENSRDIGWNYSDDMGDMYHDLLRKLGLK